MSVNFYPLKVADVRRETADAVSVLFDVPDDLLERFRFQPGQHLTLRSTLKGDEVRRNYSVCVAPSDNELRVAIKRIPNGVFSTWANADIKPGQVIDVMPPHGSFTWRFDKNARRQYAAFAGGSGITPILSLLKTALAAEPGSEFTLFYGNRDSASIMFLEQLAGLKNRFLGRLRVYHFLEDEEEDFDLFNGRLDKAKVAEVLAHLIAPEDIDAFFICGPGPMMSAVEDALKSAGVKPDRILIERFTTGEASATDIAAARALEQRAQGLKLQVKLDGRKRSITFDSAKGSILENARAVGFGAPFACKAGVCATCKAKVVSGKVQMKTNYGLSAEDLELGYVLTCQAVPLEDDVFLDYDV